MSRHQKADFVRATLLAAILRGDYGADGRVPREEALAEDFGMSRGTIRAGIQHLAARDVLEVTHGRPGARVRPAREWDLFDVALLETVLEGPARREVLAEVVECRLLVAPEAAALAAERATEPEIEELERRLGRARAAAGRPHLGTRPSPELAFHRGVIEAAHNRFVARMALPLEAALARGARRGREAVDRQEAILDAIRARDPGAARDAMRAWLETAGGRTRR